MTILRTAPLFWNPIRGILVGSLLAAGLVNQASAAFLTFEAAGAAPASITTARDDFRTAVGGGTVAGANGDFGGLRREINWDGVGNGAADPALLPNDFFNTTSPRGVVFSTPGTGVMVSANAGQPSAILFGFQNDFQTFSAQRLFTAINSPVLDVLFFLPGTSTAATTSAFGLVFTDVEVAGTTKIEFFDGGGSLIYSRDAMVAGNQGLTFLGAVAQDGEQIARVRITSGSNTIVSNGVLGNPNDDVVAMDDFLYATPLATTVPEPMTLGLVGFSLVAFGLTRKRLRR